MTVIHKPIACDRIDLSNQNTISYISVMTEITKTNDEMPFAIQRFVLHWGDMGTQWGVNRTVAQIHALLFVSDHPMNAEQISETLNVARSNVSNSIKELLNWRLIERMPIPGDRRDYFRAETDVWEIALRIAAVRKQREIDPALRILKTCIDTAEHDRRVSKAQRERLKQMHDFTASVDRWYGQMLNVSPSILMRIIKMGDKVVGLLGLGSKKKAK